MLLMQMQVGFAEDAAEALENQKSASVVVADALRLAILRGHFIPGQTLPQEAIAKQVGVSRAPVRDALRQMVTEGLVVIHPRRGAEVARLTPEDFQELCLLREMLETQALRLSVPKMTETDLAHAEAVLKQIDDDPNPAHMAELNLAFHESIYQAAGLPKVLSIIRTVHHSALPYHHLAFVANDLKSFSQAQHRAILQACRERDVELAVALLMEQIQAARLLSSTCEADTGLFASEA
jgi:DNA-binding GntR family transcriptional regulator